MAMGEALSVSINPADARAEIAGAWGLQASGQVRRAPLLLTQLRIPCACGRRLTGIQYVFVEDTLHMVGVCLECGEQRAIFAPYRDWE